MERLLVRACVLATQIRTLVAALLSSNRRPNIEDTMEITDNDRERMARIMLLQPNYPEGWPRDLIDRMIVGEREKGRIWLHQELSAMYTAPPTLSSRIDRLERIVAHLCPDKSDDV